LVDGNRNGDSVLFDHKVHIQRTGGEESCAVCHHLNMPLDRSSSCCECHRDMYLSTPLFRHDLHVAATGGNGGCSQCHAGYAAAKTYETAAPCSRCHEQYPIANPVIPASGERWRPAVSYMNAMHGLCVTCQEK
jgi:hypothetical protein